MEMNYMRWYDDEITNEENKVDSEPTGVSGDAGSYDASEDTSASEVSYNTGVDGDVGQFDPSSDDVVNFSEVGYDDLGTGVEGDVGPVAPEEVIDVSDIRYDDDAPTGGPTEPDPFINPGDDIFDPNNPVTPGTGIDPIGPGPVIPDNPNIPEEPILDPSGPDIPDFPGIDDPIIPTGAPTEAPTTAPTEAPTTAPTEAPTTAPTEAPTTAPIEAPTTAPIEAPTTAPSEPDPVQPEPAPQPIQPTSAPVIPTPAPVKPTLAPQEDEFHQPDVPEGGYQPVQPYVDAGYEVDTKFAGVKKNDNEPTVVATRQNSNGDSIKLLDLGNGTYVLNNGIYNAMCAPDGNYYVPNSDGSLTQLDKNALTIMFGDVRNYGTQLYSQSVVKANMPSSTVSATAAAVKPSASLEYDATQSGFGQSNPYSKQFDSNYSKYLDLAKKTVRGDYGNADARKAEFAKRGLDYDKVQDVINYYDKNGGIEQLAAASVEKDAATLKGAFGQTVGWSNPDTQDYIQQLQKRLENSKHDTERQEIAKQIAAEKTKLERAAKESGKKEKPGDLDKVLKASALVDDINSNRGHEDTSIDVTG